MPASLGGTATASSVLVVDSWPVMEWLKKREPVTTRFRQILLDAEMDHVVLLLSSINLGEIYYNSWNEWNRARAELVYEGLLTLPIQTVHPTSSDVMAAARIKAEFKVSYADAFAAVLAVEYGAPVLTGDHDFWKIQRRGLIAVDWIGA